MVQDQFDPEYYLGKYETINKTTGQKVNMAFLHIQYSSVHINMLFFSKNSSLEKHTVFHVAKAFLS